MKDFNVRLGYFIAITIGLAYCYQAWFNYDLSKTIDEQLEAHNKVTKGYTKIIASQQSAIEHWKAMYYGSQTSNYQLEQQIDVISEYWKKEYLKVSDELFDVKNTR
tara:strand:- start:226 stop:543 length:318 start_codon:yes stop_codon:yes gene_type:complete